MSDRTVVVTDTEVEIVESAVQGPIGADGMTGATGASGTGQCELAYAEKTANQTITTSTADITGLSVTFTAGTRPIMLRFFHNTCLFIGTPGESVSFLITDSSNVVQGSGGCTAGHLKGGVVFTDSGRVEVRLGSLTNGVSYTYKVRMLGTAAGTLVVAATSKSFLQAVEV